MICQTLLVILIVVVINKASLIPVEALEQFKEHIRLLNSLRRRCSLD